MDVILNLFRSRFNMVDLMHFADFEDETLKLMMFQNGPSRDEFIKFLVFKFLLDIDPGSKDSQNYNLENIFISFGILNKNDAQNFLNNTLSTKLHITIWKRIIEALIPNTKIIPKYPNNRNELIYELNDYFHTLRNKNYLPPELVSKLNSKILSNENCESIEKSLEKIIKILTKQIRSDQNNDNTTFSNCEDQSSKHNSLELVDLISIKKEIDQYNQISNEKKIILSNSKQSYKITPHEFVEITKNKNFMSTNYLESKVDNIHKLLKADQDLQTLTKSSEEQDMKIN